MLLVAGFGLFWPPRPAADDGAFSAAELSMAGGGSLEMVGQDLTITLPSSLSSIVLRTPSGEEIARIGGPRPRQLGE